MRKAVLLSLIFIPLFITQSFSQISLFPSVVFIDPQTRSGSMKIMNTSDEFRELEISFRFGYVEFNDTTGKSTINYDDKAYEDKFSLIPFIKVFPRKLAMPPGETQTIRFLVFGVSDLDPGTYITRMVARSSPVTEQVDTIGDGKIMAAINIVSEMVGFIAYQHKEVNSNVTFDYVKTDVDSIMVTTYWNFDKTGNSPFWGNMEAKIFDSEDNVVAEGRRWIAIYKKSYVAFAFENSGIFEPGEYRLSVILDGNRDDIPEDRKMEFETIEREYSFTYP